MYKSLFIALNVIGILSVPMLYTGDIKVTQTGNSTVAPGDEIEVTINIEKQGVAGPARLKLDLSNAQGIEIEDIETEGASFSFNEKSALFIWYSIKSDSKVTLTYSIIADADASGSKTITGSFSYLDEDERKQKDIQPFNFTISGDGNVTANNDPVVIEGSDEDETVEAVAANTSPSTSSSNNPAASTNSEEVDEVEANNEVEQSNLSSTANDENSSPVENSPVVIEGEDVDETVEVVSTISPSATNKTAPEDVTVTRSVAKTGNDYIVTISVFKGINGGFARIKEDIPSGFTAEKVEAAGSIFKYADNAAKFLWSQIPSNKENIEVKYRLIPSSEAAGDYTLNGSFSAEFLIEDDKPKKLKIAPSSISVENPTASNSSAEEAQSSTKVIASNNDNKEDIDNSSANNDKVEESTTVSTASSNGIKYRVQIIAAHNTVSKRYVKKAFGYSGPVNIDNHEGWVKYTTNGYGSYDEARKNRNKLNKYDFDGPFVTAYNKGERITVQEALMISNQSWIQ